MLPKSSENEKPRRTLTKNVISQVKKQKVTFKTKKIVQDNLKQLP